MILVGNQIITKLSTRKHKPLIHRHRVREDNSPWVPSTGGVDVGVVAVENGSTTTLSRPSPPCHHEHHITNTTMTTRSSPARRCSRETSPATVAVGVAMRRSSTGPSWWRCWRRPKRILAGRRWRQTMPATDESTGRRTRVLRVGGEQTRSRKSNRLGGN